MGNKQKSCTNNHSTFMDELNQTQLADFNAKKYLLMAAYQIPSRNDQGKVEC